MRGSLQAHGQPLPGEERPVHLAGVHGGVEGHPVAARGIDAARAQEVLRLGRRGEPEEPAHPGQTVRRGHLEDPHPAGSGAATWGVW